MHEKEQQQYNECGAQEKTYAPECNDQVQGLGCSTGEAKRESSLLQSLRHRREALRIELDRVREHINKVTHVPSQISADELLQIVESTQQALYIQ